MKKILFCFCILCGTSAFAIDMPSLRKQMANEGDLAGIFDEVPEGTVVKDEIKRREKISSRSSVRRVWQSRKEAFSVLLQEVFKNPTGENMRELACQIEALKHEVEKGLKICHAGELYDCGRFEDSALRDYLREMFGIYCYLYRGMVTLANEMGISPESFIKRGLDNEDLRNTGDDVIWSVEDLEKPYLTETPKKQKEYIEEVNTGNDFRYLLALYHLAKISSKYTFFGYVKNDGIKVDKNCLFVKVKNRNIKISFPLRKDMVGKFSPDSPTWRKPGNKIISPLIFGEKIDTPVNGCWKFHVTATPFSAKKVIKHVLPYLHRYNIDYKIMPDIGVMRIFYLNERFGHVSQYGKFITIYPQTRQVSQRIANDLDGILSNRGFQGGGIVIPSHDENDPKCFTEKDFVTCNGDYSVGTSGGLFARYVFDYNANDGRGVLDEWEQRRIPVILESLLEESAEYMPHSLTYCGISFGGEDFVKNIRILGLVNYLRSQRQRYDQFLLKPIPEETER